MEKDTIYMVFYMHVMLSSLSTQTEASQQKYGELKHL